MVPQIVVDGSRSGKSVKRFLRSWNCVDTEGRGPGGRKTEPRKVIHNMEKIAVSSRRDR